MADSPPTFSAGSLPSNPPVPISAAINVTSGIWSVTFDSPLQPGAVDTSNWAIRASDMDRNILSAVATGSQVGGASSVGSANEGPDIVTYSPPPFDVLNLSSQAAIAFADFPLTVT